jgi:flagellar biosynthesis protein FlhG
MVDRVAGSPGRPASGREDRGALGPRGRGLFDRLLSGLRGAPAVRQEATTLAIASGKGGTGKSFVATNLAVVLHNRSKAVTLVDCDFGLACNHLLMGVKPTLTLQQLLTGKAIMRDVRTRTPCGPHLVPGASGVRKMADLTDKELAVLARELGGLAALEDVLLLDVGAGIGPQTVLTMLCADHIVLVTQPEIAALVDAYAVVKCVAQLDESARFLVIVNRVTTPGRGEQAFQKLTEVARHHVGVSLQYLGEIEEDPRVSQHRLGQLPLVATDPQGPLGRSFEAIADRLETAVGALGRREVAGDAGVEARFKRHRLFL